MAKNKQEFDMDYYNEENSEENYIVSQDKILIRGVEVPFPLVLANNLKTANQLIEHKFDVVFFIDGMEGSGKSELGKECGLILNSNFSEDDIVFTPEQFSEWTLNKKRKKGDVVLWDEFIFGGNSADALTSMQNMLTKMFVTMRSKGLIVILLAPSLFLIRKYFAIFRTRFLLHCYTKGLSRGYTKFYSYSAKHMLVNYGYKTWLYSPKVKPSFTCRFSAWSSQFLDEKKIEVKKHAAIKSLEENDKKKIKMTPKQEEYFCKIPLGSIFPHDSTERRTLWNLQNQIRTLRGFDNGKGEKDTIL